MLRPLPQLQLPQLLVQGLLLAPMFLPEGTDQDLDLGQFWLLDLLLLQGLRTLLPQGVSRMEEPQITILMIIIRTTLRKIEELRRNRSKQGMKRRILNEEAAL